MADNVYVNDRSVLHKDSCGKGMAAFPDVCLCPPPPPAGPIPTPLPNNTMSSDVADCASSVLADSNPIATKDSYISKSTGDEAGKPQGGNVVTHVTNGKAYFVAFSMDVKAEGKAVPRHLDMLTHNHASGAPGTPPWVELAKQMFAPGGACADNPPRCQLTTQEDCSDKSGGAQTGHHVVPSHCFVKQGMRAANVAGEAGTCIPGAGKYRTADAPCVCVSGKYKHSRPRVNGRRRLGQHGRIHKRIDFMEAVHALQGGWTYPQAREEGAKSVCEVIPGCKKACIEAQLDLYHQDHCKIDDELKLRTLGKSGKYRKRALAYIKKVQEAFN